MMKSRRTKIVCTLGPAVDSFQAVRNLIKGGMNVARINMSHCDPPTAERWINWIQKASQEQGKLTAVLIDLPGPKFRLGILQPDPLPVKRGSEVLACIASGTKPIPNAIPLPKGLFHLLQPHSRLIVGDGNPVLRVISLHRTHATLRALSRGFLKSRQGISLSGASSKLSAFTPLDQKLLHPLLSKGMDFVALSFVRTPKDVKALRKFLSPHHSDVKIIAKIETREAIKNIQGILQESDGVLVARGDLGLQLPLEQIPLWQKKITDLGAQLGKPVIIATQMLESMMSQPKPTRAEVTDVMNAVLDGADALMLSGETAAGEYPLLALSTMNRFILTAEASKLFYQRMRARSLPSKQEATSALAQSAQQISDTLNADAILSFSVTGFTARMIARFRPKAPILCATPRETTAKQVSLLWGVQPLLCPPFGTTEEMIDVGIKTALARGLLHPGDLVVITAGLPVGKPGTTNLLTLKRITKTS
jgi:pyruvate kinase